MPWIPVTSWLLPQGYPTRVEIARMPATPINHVRSIPIERESLGSAILQVPLVVGIDNIIIPNRKRQHDFDLHQSDLLPDTVSRSAFERAPSILVRVEGFTLRYEKSLRKELLCARPVTRVVLDAVMTAPHEAVLGGVFAAVSADEEVPGLSLAQARDGRVQAHGFFDTGECERELVD